MKTVMIMVGVPGSGKSTLAKRYERKYKNVTIVSADSFFVCRDSGEYKFDPARLPLAHANCMNQYINAVTTMGEGDIVIVDNTNMQPWEWMNYRDLAVRLGCKVEFHVFECDQLWQVRICAARNTHNVPVEVVARMAVNYQDEGYPDAVQYHSIGGTN